MKTIPLKVETKMMAFEDSTATAPDRLTGLKNIVAFRARQVKSGTGGYSNHHHTDKGILLNMEMTLML